MHKATLMRAAGLVAGLALLTGCGDSHPIAGPGPEATASAPADPVPPYTPASAAFAAVAASAATPSAEASGKCNLDAIDGAAPGSKRLAHAGQALFAGWAASNDGTSVPQTVTIVLHGETDFQLQAPTGAPRPDVASANGEAGLAQSGYAVKADLSAVAPGRYGVALRYTAGGKTWRCESRHAVTIE